MSIVEDDETQKNGLVMILFGYKHPTMTSPNIDILLMFKATRFSTSLPVRVTCWHLCKLPSASVSVMNAISYVSKFFDRNFRIRIRIHIGTWLFLFSSLLFLFLFFCSFVLFPFKRTVISYTSKKAPHSLSLFIYYFLIQFYKWINIIFL